MLTYFRHSLEVSQLVTYFNLSVAVWAVLVTGAVPEIASNPLFFLKQVRFQRFHSSSVYLAFLKFTLSRGFSDVMKKAH